MVFIMFVSLYSIRVVLGILGEIDYGIYSAIGGVVLAFSFISQTLVSASQRFFSVDLSKGNSTELNKTYNSILFSYIIITVVIVLLLETCGLWFVQNKMTIPQERMSTALILFHFSTFTFISNILVNPYMSMLIANEDMKTYAYISILEAILKLGVAFSLLIIQYDKLKLYGILLFATSIIVFSIYYTVCKRRYDYVFINWKVDCKKLKEVFLFSSWTLFGTLAGTANGQCINILLNVFFGPIANTAYAIGNQISGMISQITGNFFSAVRPPITKSYAIGDKQKTSELFYFSSKILFVLILMIVIPLYLELEYILTLWLGSIEQYTVQFSRLLLIYITLIAISNPITAIIHAAGAVKKYHLVVDGFTLLSLPTTYIAFKLGYEPYMAFVISNIIFSIAHIIRLAVLKSVISFSYTEYIIKLILPSVLIIIASTFVVTFVELCISHDFLRLIMVFTTSIIVILILTLYLLMTKPERDRVINFIKHKIKK